MIASLAKLIVVAANICLWTLIAPVWLAHLVRTMLHYSLATIRNLYVGASPPDPAIIELQAGMWSRGYELRERGLNELINRGIVPKRSSPDPEAKPPKSKRNHAFALHRSNSYYHEVIVDLGYHAPLR
jgi:hypothetical protein